MRQALILFVVLGLLICPVTASEIASRDMGQLRQALPYSAKRMVDPVSNDGTKGVNQSIKQILISAMDESTDTIRSVIGMICQIMLITVLCGIVSCRDDCNVERTVVMMGTVALVLVCSSDVSGMIGSGITTMDEIRNFSSVLLPVMASAAAGTGAMNGATVLYTITVLFSNMLIGICNKLLMPMVYSGLALAVADSVLQSQRMKQLRELIGWVIKTSLKWIMYIYTGFLSLSGVLAGSADAIALKTAKMAVSGMVPVVGGIISDAAETVLAGAGLLKHSIGTFGMLAILAIFIVPFLKISIWLIGFRLVSALCAVVESKLSGCMDAVSDAMGYILAMIGSCSLMNLLACFSFFKTVSP